MRYPLCRRPAHVFRDRTPQQHALPAIEGSADAMCLAFVALDAHRDFTLVIAANRDEAYARGTDAAHWWPEGILAGRDRVAGGTWMGVTRQGRWSLVTNVRDAGHKDAAAPSRGAI